MHQILPNFDPETVRRVIQNDLPDLKIEAISLIENGWDHLVADINGQWIFRFPKSAHIYSNADLRFEVEVVILNLLKNKITLSIPRIEFLGKSFTYMAYQKIPGNCLTREVFDRMNQTEKEKLVFDLANFLFEIHNSLTVEEARKLGIRDENLPSYSDLVKAVLLKHMTDRLVRSFAEETLKEFEAINPTEDELVFLYNDLHTDNMAFDDVNRKLNGVYDFGDICVGDVNMDFYPLYKFDPNFMKAVVEKYQEFSGRRLNLRRMVIYGRMGELCDLAEYIDKPQSPVYQNALHRVIKWQSEMDIFKIQ
ncbi:MAG TPA: aminoglycoside phosphotransferase family protein [Blastocatellia bacterium]|nr:aminoglycoside phosphotransferase family protein [Blastocatellia bacterium]